MSVGSKVKIAYTSNAYAARHVGRVGIIIGETPNGMWIVDLGDGARDYWAYKHNVRPAD